MSYAPAAVLALARGMDAAARALTARGIGISDTRDFARARRGLLASAPELRERDLIKMASLASAIAERLRERQVPARTATLASQAAVAVFTAAWDDWINDAAADLASLMQRGLADLRQAVGPG